MPRHGRLYVPLDANFFEDEKILDAGERAGWLYLAMCCRAKQLGTDGYLTERQIARLQLPDWRARLDRLLEAGAVWRVDPVDNPPGTAGERRSPGRGVVSAGSVGGVRYWIVSWPKWNEPIKTVEDRRRSDRERKAAGRPDSSRIPAGIRLESGSQRREEKRREPGPAGTPVENCPHGAGSTDRCALCRRETLTVVQS